jgi:catalase-peroxidase
MTNDFFVNLLDNGTVWSKSEENSYEGRDRESGQTKGCSGGGSVLFSAR